MRIRRLPYPNNNRTRSEMKMRELLILLFSILLFSPQGWSKGIPKFSKTMCADGRAGTQARKSYCTKLCILKHKPHWCKKQNHQNCMDVIHRGCSTQTASAKSYFMGANASGSSTASTCSGWQHIYTHLCEVLVKLPRSKESPKKGRMQYLGGQKSNSKGMPATRTP